MNKVITIYNAHHGQLTKGYEFNDLGVAMSKIIKSPKMPQYHLPTKVLWFLFDCQAYS